MEIGIATAPWVTYSTRSIDNFEEKEMMKRNEFFDSLLISIYKLPVNHIRLGVFEYLREYGLVDAIFHETREQGKHNLVDIESFRQWMNYGGRDINTMLNWATTTQGHSFWEYHNMCHRDHRIPDRRAWGDYMSASRQPYSSEVSAWT